MNSTKPTDAVLEAMVDRVETELLAPRHHSEQRRRRVRVVAIVSAGVLLFGAGLSVTAAVAFPHPPTAPGVEQLQPNGQVVTDAFALTVQCLNNSNAGIFTFGKGSVPGEAAAYRDPASVCPAASTPSAIKAAVAARAATLTAQGKTCETDVINDSDQQVVWRSTTGSDGRTSVTQTPSSGLPATGCPLANLPVRPGPSVPLAVCRIDSKNAAVFGRGNESAEDFCNDLGEEVWKG